MKKFLLIVVILLGIINTTQARDFELKAYKLSMALSENDVKQKDVNINIIWNMDTKHLEIYSEKTQIIDYFITNSYQGDDGFYEIVGYATDSNYKQIAINFSIDMRYNSNLIIITISYSDLAYSYKCYAIQ